MPRVGKAGVSTLEAKLKFPRQYAISCQRVSLKQIWMCPYKLRDVYTENKAALVYRVAKQLSGPMADTSSPSERHHN